MKTNIKQYNHDLDFERVNQFLIEIYEPTEQHLNFLQPRWEFFHFHPMIWETDRSVIGVVEEKGQINAIVTYEGHQGEVFFQIRPGFEHLKLDLLDYAESKFSGMSRSKNRPIRAVYVNDFDMELQAEVQRRGYEQWPDFDQPMACFYPSQPIPEIKLPEGYKLQSLADKNDLRKVNKVLWRGFNHEGPPPEEEIEGRKFMQSAPNFRHDLNIVVVAPNGDYASYAGMWYVAENKVGYVEPVATDPDYRRMGLGKAAVMEGVRRVIAEGAEIVWVGSDQPFYLAMGFAVKFALVPWVKFLD